MEVVAFGGSLRGQTLDLGFVGFLVDSFLWNTAFGKKPLEAFFIPLLGVCSTYDEGPSILGPHSLLRYVLVALTTILYRSS